MKKALILFIFALQLSHVGCKENAKGNIPKVIVEAFTIKYPSETDPDWQVDKNGNYEAHCKKEKIHYRADFTPNGNWVETESSIKRKELPKAILKVVHRDYNNVNVVEIEKVNHASKGLFYDVEFKIEGEKNDVKFKQDGTIIKS